MNRDFFVGTFNRQPDLLRAMLAFNGLLDFPPLPDVLAALPNAETLWENTAVRRRFGACCKPDPDFWDFEDEVFRLALMDATTLERLALTFGVAAIAPDICRLLRRNEVRDARERLGDALYTYALHRARFQVEANVVPAAMHAVSRQEDVPVHIRARAVGAWSLLALTSNWPEQLRACFALVAPSSGGATASEPALNADHQKRLWVAVKKVLLKEVAPLWAPCFD